ncbi:acid sphingomyelinase-like phosphodiesterase 3b [Centruroides vittatus]|uniref:acid sphingomyelinase-like phosphodiesterase 3b n=1 Tax=Centruroides vittatus TaxID=120091 RepID=UPI00350EB61E
MSLKQQFCALSLLFFQFILIRSYPTEDGNVGTFWQITDIHWDKQYSIRGNPNEMCHLTISTTGDYLNGDYGNFNCDSPWLLVNSSIEAMIKYKSDPDFIIWTGDNAPHIWNPSPNFKSITSILAKITQLLSLKFPNSTILPVLGNHDTFPPDTIPQNATTTYYNQYLTTGRWNEILPNSTWNTFLQGGYYSFPLSSSLTILGLNTILWYKSNTLTLNSTDPANQYIWLENELMEAEKEGKKVYIIGHVSPGHSNRGVWNEINPSLYQERFNEKYIDIVNKYSNVIAGQFFAHLHADLFGLFRNKDRITSSMLLSSSITPWHSIEPSMKGVSVSPNPSIRLYYYNRQDGKILDYDHFFLNLTKANKLFDTKLDNQENDSSEFTWKLFYTFTKEYELEDVTTRSLEELFKKLKTKPGFFEKYYNFTTVGKENGLCDKICIRLHLCAISFQSHHNYSSCVKIPEQQIKSIVETTTPVPFHKPVAPQDTRKRPNTASSRNILIGCTLSLLVLIMILVVVYIKRSRLARGPRFVRFQ